MGFKLTSLCLAVKGLKRRIRSSWDHVPARKVDWRPFVKSENASKVITIGAAFITTQGPRTSSR